MSYHEPVTDGSAEARDRRLGLRYVGAVEGCYALSDRRLEDGVTVFPCRTLSISSTSATVTGTAIGAIGDPLTAKLDGFGILRGIIERVSADGFMFKIEATDRQRLRIAAKIDFLKKKAARKQSERRIYKRRQPRDARSTMGLTDGRVVNCLVNDYSRSGVAVGTNIKPEIGEKVVIGRLTGRIARHLASGLGIRFDEIQAMAGLEALITGYEVVG